MENKYITVAYKLYVMEEGKPELVEAIQDVAQLLETIPYEVLAGISKRVKRVYFKE